MTLTHNEMLNKIFQSCKAGVTLQNTLFTDQRLCSEKKHIFYFIYKREFLKAVDIIGSILHICFKIYSEPGDLVHAWNKPRKRYCTKQNSFLNNLHHDMKYDIKVLG